MTKEQKLEVKQILPLYLENQHSINTKKLFHCLNPNHEDCTASMGYNSRNETVHCFGCGATYDIFDLIGIDYPSKCPSDKFQRAYSIYKQYSEEAHNK